MNAPRLIVVASLALLVLDFVAARTVYSEWRSFCETQWLHIWLAASIPLGFPTTYFISRIKMKQGIRTAFVVETFLTLGSFLFLSWGAYLLASYDTRGVCHLTSAGVFKWLESSVVVSWLTVAIVCVVIFTSTALSVGVASWRQGGDSLFTKFKGRFVAGYEGCQVSLEYKVPYMAEDKWYPVKSSCASFCILVSAVAVPVLTYLAILCTSHSRLVEIPDDRKTNAAVGCWISAFMYAATFIVCYNFKAKEFKTRLGYTRQND